MYWETMEPIEFVGFFKGFLTSFVTGGSMEEAVE
jgi:hypothetical protein